MCLQVLIIFKLPFHLLYRPSYIEQPFLCRIYVIGRSLHSLRVTTLSAFPVRFTDPASEPTYHRVKYLSRRYNRISPCRCTLHRYRRRLRRSGAETRARKPWYSNNADSLLRKGNRPRPRESRPDIRVSDNCACVLASTRKKEKERKKSSRRSRVNVHTYERLASVFAVAQFLQFTAVS